MISCTRWESDPGIPTRADESRAYESLRPGLSVAGRLLHSPADARSTLKVHPLHATPPAFTTARKGSLSGSGFVGMALGTEFNLSLWLLLASC